MSGKYHSWSAHPLSKIGLVGLLGLLLLVRLGYAQTLTENKSSILQGTLQILPVKPLPNNTPIQIQPGTPVHLVVTVENIGKHESPAGELYVKYAFIQPLDKEKGSVLFESEKKALPSIQPGKKVEIPFDNPHQIPSLPDYFRNDWPFREYKAMAIVNHEEHLIGTLAVNFSAYYYPGENIEIPAVILQKK